MFLLFLICASVLASIYGDKTISFQIPTPRGSSYDIFTQSVINYWTPERMANAQSKDVFINNEESIARFLNPKISVDRSDNVQRSVPPTLPAENRNQRSSILNDSSRMPRVVGRVFYTVNGAASSCSAAVVTASNQDCVMTAAHCVFDYPTKTWTSNWIFVPQYKNGSVPFGIWTARSLYTKTSWISNQDYNSDVGIALMNANNLGQHIQQVIGALGIKWNGNKATSVNVFGYPINKVNGQMMSTCAGPITAESRFTNYNGHRATCDLTYGASGGPWIENYNTATMLGDIISVSSFIMLSEPGFIYGPYFDTNIYNLYNDCQKL